MSEAAGERKLEAQLAAIRRAREIHCPYCDALWVDDEYQCVSFHGEEPDVEVQCENEHCELFFMVKAHVERTYETLQMQQPGTCRCGEACTDPPCQGCYNAQC